MQYNITYKPPNKDSKIRMWWARLIGPMSDRQYVPLSGIPLPPISSSDKLDTVQSYENEPTPTYFEKSVCHHLLKVVCFAFVLVVKPLDIKLFPPTLPRKLNSPNFSTPTTSTCQSFPAHPAPPPTPPKSNCWVSLRRATLIRLWRNCSCRAPQDLVRGWCVSARRLLLVIPLLCFVDSARLVKRVTLSWLDQLKLQQFSRK